MCVCLLPNLCLCVVITDTVHVSGSSTPVQTHHMQSENITEKKKSRDVCRHPKQTEKLGFILNLYSMTIS